VKESGWLRGTNPTEMLRFLRGRARDRKLRLFMVACVRRVWDLLTDERSRRAVEVVERFVDGQATEEELRAAGSDATETLGLLAATLHQANQTGTILSPAMRAAYRVAGTILDATIPLRLEYVMWSSKVTGMGRAVALGLDPLDRTNRAVREALTKEFRIQAHLLRDIFGNPFRPVTVDPSWLGWKDGTVVQLARSIYDDRRFGDLPILADALEESGCSDPDILGHCRGPGPHVRGCWVVDSVLGKG
jgi:hypothetical protein